MREFISYVGENYDKKREELKQKINKEAPNQEKYVKLYMYKAGELLESFMWTEYERYVDKYIDKTKYTNPAILKDNFLEGAQVSGYTVGIETEDKFIKIWDKFKESADKQDRELTLSFKKELFEYYGVSDNKQIEDIYTLCVKASKDGGCYFIEEHLVDILDLMGIRKDINPEILDEEK